MDGSISCLALVFVFLIASVNSLAAIYDVAVYVWPAYQPDDRFVYGYLNTLWRVFVKK